MHPILFKLGPVTIYTYGVCVFLGVILGYFVCLREAKKDGVDSRLVGDVLFWTLLFAFLGARIFYIIVNFGIFLENPASIIFSRSGFVFYGGLIFGVITLKFLIKRYHADFLEFMDIFAPGLALGHAFGRLGCFFYGCCYGKVTKSAIGILFPPDSPAGNLGEKVIPTQLISSFFLFMLFFVLLLIKRRKKYGGQVFIAYLFFYGSFRFIIEFFRGDSRGGIGFLSTSGGISIILAGIAVFLWTIKKIQGTVNR